MIIINIINFIFEYLLMLINYTKIKLTIIKYKQTNINIYKYKCNFVIYLNTKLFKDFIESNLSCSLNISIL